MIAEHSKDSPNVISYPPLVFLTALGAGFLLNWLIRLPSFCSLPISGGLLATAGFFLGMWAFAQCIGQGLLCGLTFPSWHL